MISKKSKNASLAIIGVLSPSVSMSIAKQLDASIPTIMIVFVKSGIAPFEYSIMLFATVIGFIVFDEIPAISTIIGVSIIIASTYTMVHQDKKSKLYYTKSQIKKI